MMKATRFLAIFTLTAAVVFMCGGCRQARQPSAGLQSRDANPAQAAASQSTSMQVEPLSTDDVQLYLGVMRGAAARWNNPPPEDRQILERAKRVTEAIKNGQPPSSTDMEALRKATLMRVDMDEIVAREQNVDLSKYRGIRNAIESVVQNPIAGSAGGAASRQLTATELRVQQTNAANQKTLEPYKTEIRQLLAVVRNPMHLSQ